MNGNDGTGRIIKPDEYALKSDEELEKDILEKKDEGKRGEEVVIDAKEVDDIEEVVGKKGEEVIKEKQDIDAKDVLPPEVSELVNSQSARLISGV